MKNIRKIVAILAVALMLCTMLPLSVFAAPGDVAVDCDFNDGSNGGFDRSYNENGYIVFDATTADWQCTFAYKALKSDTTYTVTFKAKANKDATLGFKINDNWGADVVKEEVAVSTEWQDYELTIDVPTITSAIVMFTSGYPAGDAPIYCIDDLKIAEKAEELVVGVVKNGNFENGSEGWALNGSASIENGALKLDNSGQWSEAAMQTIAVEVGTEYTLRWKSQRISGNGAFLMFILKGSDSTNHGATGQNWMNETSGNWVENSLVFTATEETLKLKLSAEVDNPGVILIDDITLTATPKAVVGQITNGDFETGDATAWRTWQSTEINAAAAHSGSYGANIKGNGGWGGFLDQDFSVEDGKTYQFSFWYKVNTSGFNWSLKGDQTSASYGSGWNTKQEWTQVAVEFVANGDTTIYLNFNGGGNGIAEDAYIDDVKLVELVDPSNDGYVINGTFETGAAAPWTTYSGTAVDAVAAKNGNYGLYIKNPTGGWGGTAFQDFSVEIGKSYEVTMWAKNLTGSRGQNIQIQNGGATVASKWFDNTFEWTLLTFEFTATAANCRINICGGGTGANEEIYVDDVKVVELKQASFDGYIYNGDFETGEVFPWDNLWGSCPTVEIVEGMEGYGLHIVAGKWNHVRQTNIAVEPNTWYKVTAWAKNASDMCLLVKNNADNDNLAIAGVNAGDEWTEFTAVFNSKDYNSILFSLMGGENDEVAEKGGIFDNIKIEVTAAPCEHEYFSPCDQHCMICGELTNPDASHNVVHAEAVAPTCTAMGNIEYWYCDVCGQAWLDEACTMNTNQRAVKLAALGHSYDDCLDTDCNNCGETREAGSHQLNYVAAVIANNCQETGHNEYWECTECGAYFGDAEASYQVNPAWISYTGEHVRPEGAADCAVVPCTLCGEDVYGVGEHDTGVAACQTGVCSKCGDTIEGFGCQNYDTPACEDGVCYYCGGFVAGFGHENGSMSACCDGECAYGCGLIYPATEDHIDEDADDYCDNCWNHLACIDEDGNGFCDICWTEMPVAEIVYGDADGDGEITTIDAALLQQFVAGWDVEVNDAADADGDGEITTIDAALLQQYVAGWDVELGPVENTVFNDGELQGW